MIINLTVAAEGERTPRHHAQIDRGQPGRQVEFSSHTPKPATYIRHRDGDWHLGDGNWYVGICKRVALNAPTKQRRALKKATDIQQPR